MQQKLTDAVELPSKFPGIIFAAKPHMLSDILNSATASTARPGLIAKFKEVREATENLCVPLNDEDYLLSSTQDTSPPKWHLAHTTWFFEKFILRQWERNFPTFSPTYDYLFNSYYQILGPYLPKKERFLLSRPLLGEIYKYRKYINEKIEAFLGACPPNLWEEVFARVSLGINHEQQHQELILMDMKQNFFSLPSKPSFAKDMAFRVRSVPTFHLNDWADFQGGLYEIGSDGSDFHYDNEAGKHQVWLEPFQLSKHLVSNGDYLEFIEAGGYENPHYWLSDGWDTLNQKKWNAPLYWEKFGNTFHTMNPEGMKPLDLLEPVSHVSYYEADAYAKFRDARLPTEFEWESVAKEEKMLGSFMEENRFHPLPRATSKQSKLPDLHGELWEWTGSAYLKYPRYHPFRAELHEYNSKFMCNQMVLRGGSCVTPKSHYRTQYRNFYYPHQRWQFSGFRLARSI